MKIKKLKGAIVFVITIIIIMILFNIIYGNFATITLEQDVALLQFTDASALEQAVAINITRGRIQQVVNILLMMLIGIRILFLIKTNFSVLKEMIDNYWEN